MFGFLAGLCGMEHGFFEILQGNAAPGGIVIEAIGPAQRFWEAGTEPAMTIVPSFLVSGVLAMAAGLAVIVWSGWFVHRRYGAPVLAGLVILLLLVGGGFAPVFGAAPAVVLAARLDKPPPRWVARIPARARRLLSSTWQGALVVFALAYLFCILCAIFGWPLTAFFDASTTNNILLVIGLGVLGLMFYIILAGFAREIEAGGGPG